MNELYIELTVLLGFDFIQKNFYSNYKDQSYTDMLLSTSCEFLSNIRKIIRKLLKNTELNYISINLQLSANFLLLIKKKSKNSGICLICDEYCAKLEDHFSTSHKLSHNYYLSYKKSFGPLTENFNPSSLTRKKSWLIKPGACINKTEKKSGKMGSKPVDILKNIGVNKANLNQTLFNMAEKYVDTIVEKGFFKDKPIDNKGIEEDFGGFEIFKEGQNFEICEICKVPVVDKDKNKHMRAHKHNELINCPMCTKVIKQRYLIKHLKRHCLTNSNNN